MPAESCSNCRFAWIIPHPQGLESEQANCRRYPPQVNLAFLRQTGMGLGAASYPMMMPIQQTWCGEWLDAGPEGAPVMEVKPTSETSH